MSDYVKSTNFYVKDSLLVGNPDKIVKGSELDTEFNNIATAIASKANYASPNLTGIPTAPTAANGTNTSQLATTAFVKNTVDVNNTNVNITGGTISGISPPIPVASGGTGLNTLTSESIMIGNGTEDVKFISPGTAGNVLVSNGTIWESKAAPGITSSEGDAPYFASRGFVRFNGTSGGITLAKNVASVAKNSTGKYIITLTTPLIDANAIVIGTTKSITGEFFSVSVGAVTSSTIEIWCFSSSYSPSGGYFVTVLADSDNINVAIFR